MLFVRIIYGNTGFSGRSGKLRVKPENQMNASVKLLCYKQKVLKNGEHPTVASDLQSDTFVVRDGFVVYSSD